MAQSGHVTGHLAAHGAAPTWSTRNVQVWLGVYLCKGVWWVLQTGLDEWLCPKDGSWDSLWCGIPGLAQDFLLMKFCKNSSMRGWRKESSVFAKTFSLWPTVCFPSKVVKWEKDLVMILAHLPYSCWWWRELHGHAQIELMATMILLIIEILHRLECMKPKNNGINYLSTVAGFQLLMGETSGEAPGMFTSS